MMTATNRESVRPSHRKIRIFALDPSLQTWLDTATIGSVEISIPWEAPPKYGIEKLNSRPDGPYPGPIGEYLEVIDYDPASDCFYEPIDLNDPYLLEKHGTDPAEGNPQFHQQMVYAVSMKTIELFELALGRPILWNTQCEDDTRKFVPRLRLYPHAFRDANAYYSSSKKAILFGYFPATSDPSGHHLPGGTVFSCLSHDIIVHELSHALLDGLHRRFIEDSNPDALAFHEAFADIVALLQHFTYPEIVRYELSRSRGNLNSAKLLGQLAKEFGRAIGRSDALRSAIGKRPDPTALNRVFEPHARGAILLAALFDAFITIYDARKASLVRLATGGTGVLGKGALLPDLVDHLANEASKTATHVLNICIRALDYLPPVDVTFGDYLRALITADYDMVPDDPWRYRVAFIEAFRRHGIYPEGVRNLSEESLLWEEPRNPETDEVGHFTFTEKMRGMVSEWNLGFDRYELYKQMRDACRNAHEVFKTSWDYKSKYLKGLDYDPKTDFLEVHAIRPVRRVGPDRRLLVDLLVELTQRRKVYFDDDPGDLNCSIGNQRNPGFWFRGGCTILIDMNTSRVRYCIYKDILNKERLARQKEYSKGVRNSASMRSVFLGNAEDLSSKDKVFACLHRHPGKDEESW